MKWKCFWMLVVSAVSFLSCVREEPECFVGEKVDALEDSAWEVSRWISAADASPASGSVRSAEGASWFVSASRNENRVEKALWMTAGLGVYELYVNGKPVGMEFLKPGFTHYAKTKRSFTYDITEAFHTRPGAENVLSAQVTPGWWGDKIVTPGGREGMIGKKCAFRGVLAVTYADGTQVLTGTDTEHWKAGIAGPVQHAGIFEGEIYDARILPGFETPERLSVPEENTEFSGEILPSDGAEVYLRKDLALQPVEAYVWEGVSGAVESGDRQEAAYGKVVKKRTFQGGEPMVIGPGETLVVDFGQNAAAVPAFVFQAAEGTRLTCLPGEILNDGNGALRRGMDGPEGSVHRANLRAQGDWFTLEYIFGPSRGEVSYFPHCTFFGYRYISVTATAEVRILRVESIPVTSIAKELETGTLTTGNDEINRLISNTIWGQRSNYLSIPTDCPQRDERLGWMADTQVFAETGIFFAKTDRFFHKFTRDMRDSQSETGGYPGVAPTAQYGNETMRLGWADAGIIVPWTIWKQFGDTSIIDENWDSMQRFLSHVNETRYDHEALRAENGNYQWADWLSCEALESCINLAFGPKGPLPEAVEYWSYLSGCYWAIDAGMMADMAAASGRDPAPYRQMAETAKTYLRARFLNERGEFKTPVLNTMQTPALFALRNDLVEGTAREATVRRLRENFLSHGNCLQTGFLGTSILMRTLTENGMSDIAYELLFQHDYPSWLYSIDNGATTIWERWNSYTRERGLGPVGMNSFNHYAYGSVCQWLWETAAGICADTAAPGFRHIIMKPVPDPRLGHLDAVYRSAAGLIRSSWRYEGEKWQWSFEIPEGATATVTVPGGEPVEYGAGSYSVTL